MSNVDYITKPFYFSCLQIAIRESQKFENGTALIKGVLKTLKKYNLHANMDSFCEDEFHKEESYNTSVEDVLWEWKRDSKSGYHKYNVFNIDGQKGFYTRVKL